jgi:signal transduction histidine kinase/CheY-like chemotaxis protein
MTTLAERFAAAREADAMELEQSKVRFVIEFIIVIYLLVIFLTDRVLEDHELVMLAAMGGVLLLASFDLAWILLRPGVNHLRRCMKGVADMGSATLLLYLGGETTAVLFAIYPWVVIGNGFRYGRWYLNYTQLLAVVGFGAVMLFSGFWHQHLSVGVALMLVIIALPWYTSRLLARLHSTTARLQEARGEAEAANVAKTKFLAAASHDLRQPMQALSMYASLLEQRVTDAGLARVVRGVKLSVRALEQLFDGLLDISKVECGVLQPSFVPFPLMPLMERVAEAERPVAAQKGLEIRIVPCSASVHSDPLLLERMLKNLVTNAIRYTERGKILVGCRRLRGERLRLEVLDSGIGIPEHEQGRIFNEYYQVAGAGEGLGLGLTIVKSLGELLGHPLRVRSAPGRGSAFSIELPLAPSVPPLAEPRPAAAGSLDGAVVAVVDDDVEIRNGMCLLLESWGCRALTGGSLAEVQRTLRRCEARPDAVIVDYRLAGSMTGLHVIEALRGDFGAGLPALLISGTSNLQSLRDRAGTIPIALKPVAPGKLRSFLSQMLRRPALAG